MKKTTKNYITELTAYVENIKHVKTSKKTPIYLVIDNKNR